MTTQSKITHQINLRKSRIRYLSWKKTQLETGILIVKLSVVAITPIDAIWRRSSDWILFSAELNRFHQLAKTLSRVNKELNELTSK